MGRLGLVVYTWVFGVKDWNKRTEWTTNVDVFNIIQKYKTLVFT